jgi:hypothetical protein
LQTINNQLLSSWRKAPPLLGYRQVNEDRLDKEQGWEMVWEKGDEEKIKK